MKVHPMWWLLMLGLVGAWLWWGIVVGVNVQKLPAETIPQPLPVFSGRTDPLGHPFGDTPGWLVTVTDRERKMVTRIYRDNQGAAVIIGQWTLKEDKNEHTK